MVATRLEMLQQEVEWRKCASSVEYFCENFAYIEHSDPTKGAIKFKLRPEQRDVMETWSRGQDTISLKARQIGWSTSVCVFSLHRAIFFAPSRILMLSKKQDDARDLVDKCRFTYERLPEWMRERCRRTNRSVDSMKFDNDSRIEGLPSKKDPARSKSASIIVLDEWAFYDDPENAWASIEPAMDVGGHCIALSTANGAGNFFHRFWKQAVAGVNGFKPLFYSWRVVPERDDEWYENKRMKMEPWALAQEYPNNPREAFIISGSPAFDVEALMATDHEEYQRGWLHEEADMMKFTEARNGDVHILEHPRAHGTYVVGADVAAGRATGDFSCAQVLDVETGRQVARWHGHINVDQYADELYRLGTYYNSALMAPERNGVGGELVRILRSRGYTNIYREARRTRGRTDVEETYGWLTTAGSKYAIVMGLTEAIRDGSLAVTHEATLNELMSYRHTKKGTFEGDPNDDEVMAIGIAWQVLPLARPSWFDREDRNEDRDPFRASEVFGTSARRTTRKRIGAT